MAFNIEKFRANISKYGYLPTSKYEIFVNPPPAMQGSKVAYNATNLLKFRTKNFKAPGIEILNIDAVRYAVGTSQKMPFSAKYEDISFSVLLDRNSELWNFWYEWERLIFQFSPFDDGSYRFASYAAEYKKNYATTIQLLVYTNDGNISNRFNFYDIYPVGMKEVALDWDQQSKLAQLDIVMNYKEYTSISSQKPITDLPVRGTIEGFRSDGTLIK